MSFNQKEYVGNYNKETYKMFLFHVKKDDVSVIEKLKSVTNLNKYIYSLIKNDINPSILTTKQIKDKILPILAKHNINEVYLFGSYARGEATNLSDVDIYCEVGDIKTFIDQGFLEEELEETLGKKVGILFIGTTLNDYFKEQLIRLC